MTARLALAHWVGRLVRREWRQHVLITALVAFGIAVAVLVVSTLVRFAPPDARNLAGGVVATTFRPIDAPPSADLPPEIDHLIKSYADVELVIRAATSPEGVTVDGLDPTRPLVQPWLDLRGEAWPRAGEIALSERAVVRLASAGGTNIEIGDVVTIDGAARTVVGLYENPTNLEESTGVVPIDELGVWEQALVLIPSAEHPAAIEASATIGLQLPFNTVRDNAVGAYLLGTVLCIQIAVLASAGFTVLANRRGREFGMLAALGAPPQQIGSVMMLTGLVIGVVGGVVGLAVGCGVAMGLTPLLQSAVDFRLSTTELGWGYLIPMLPLAVATALAGAWWPARRLRKVSAVDAIANRRRGREGFARSLAIGLGLLALGGVLIKLGAPKNSALHIIAGAAAVLVGGLLLAPAMAALLGSLARSGPLALRVAWREIARNRGRSAAAVGAAAVALAVPFGIASFIASLADTWQPDLPDTVARIQPAFDPDAQADSFDGTVPEEIDEVAGQVEGASLIPILTPFDRALTGEFGEPYPYSVITRRRNGGTAALRTAVASPALVALMGIQPPAPDVDVVVWTASTLDIDPSVTVERRAPGRLPSIYPEALVFGDIPGVQTDDVLVDSWLVVADQPLTTMERDRLELAGPNTGDGPYVSLPDSKPPFVAIRAIALAIGALFGLGAVSAAVALIRAEATNESRVLTAVGAGPNTSRSIGAATVVGLTVAAGVIAVTASFVTLAGVYLNPDEAFDFVMPWAELGTVLVAVPAVGGAAGWLLTTTRRDIAPN